VAFLLLRVLLSLMLVAQKSEAKASSQWRSAIKNHSCATKRQ
jgi:hypothetical protein